MQQTAFSEAIKILESIGFFTYLLPLFLIWAIMYSIMDRAKILKKEMRPLIAILASLFIWYFANLPAIAASFGLMFAGTSLVLIAVLSALLIIGLIMPSLGVEPEDLGSWLTKNPVVIVVFVALAFVFSIYLFSLTPGWKVFFGVKTPERLYNAVASLLTIIIIIGIIFWVIKKS